MQRNWYHHMNKVNHILSINSPYSAGELLATIDILKIRIHKYENWCFAYEDIGLCLLPVDYHSGLKCALAIVESLLKAHAESEHYGDYHNFEPADIN